MAISTCVVSGNLKSLGNQGLNSVSVKAYIVKPFKHTDGTMILNYEVSTTSDANGDWSLTLIETTTPATGGIPLTIAFEFTSGGAGDVLRKEYTCVIPNQASVAFSSLVTF